MDVQHFFQDRNRRVNAASPERPAAARPIEQLHPRLLYLLSRMGVVPPGDPSSLSEAMISLAVSVAISLTSDEEQMYLISRIMTDEEIAQEHLQSEELQDLNRTISLSGEEKRVLLRASPEPENNNTDDDVDNANPCLICSERSDIAVPCGCRYCLHCLRSCIRTGLRSEVDFPPRCCQPLDETTIRRAGCPALVHLFRQLAAEHAVPAAERVHCHDPGCGTFIPPAAIQEPDDEDEDEAAVGICPLCRKETCAACRGRAHRGLPCREDEDEAAVWDMMDDQGLVHCPGCGVVMALRDGCNHMTCICRTEFCYLCGHRWRTCRCPLYGGFHLRALVHERPGRPIARGGRAHLVEHTENAPRIPQLRYDPDDEILLAEAGDFAPELNNSVAAGDEQDDGGEWENPADFGPGFEGEGGERNRPHQQEERLAGHHEGHERVPNRWQNGNDDLGRQPRDLEHLTDQQLLQLIHQHEDIQPGGNNDHGGQPRELEHLTDQQLLQLVHQLEDISQAQELLALPLDDPAPEPRVYPMPIFPRRRPPPGGAGDVGAVQGLQYRRQGPLGALPAFPEREDPLERQRPLILERARGPFFDQEFHRFENQFAEAFQGMNLEGRRPGTRRGERRNQVAFRGREPRREHPRAAHQQHHDPPREERQRPRPHQEMPDQVDEAPRRPRQRPGERALEMQRLGAPRAGRAVEARPGPERRRRQHDERRIDTILRFLAGRPDDDARRRRHQR